MKVSSVLQLLKNAQEGYEAGLNAWPYDLSRKDDKQYNKGWSFGCKKRKQNDDALGLKEQE